MKPIKTLGLLAVAVMALAAFFGTAPASAAKFTAGKVGAKLTEETKVKHVSTVTGSTSECSEIAFPGSTEALEGPVLKVTPSYNGCTAFGLAVTVTNVDCMYVFQEDGTMEIAPIPPATSCEIRNVTNNFFTKCKTVWREQELPGAVSYTDNGGQITVKFNISGIDAEVIESVGLCPLTVGEHTNGTYTGESTFKAEGTTLGWDA